MIGSDGSPVSPNLFDSRDLALHSRAAWDLFQPVMSRLYKAVSYPQSYSAAHRPNIHVLPLQHLKYLRSARLHSTKTANYGHHEDIRGCYSRDNPLSRQTGPMPPTKPHVYKSPSTQKSMYFGPKTLTPACSQAQIT